MNSDSDPGWLGAFGMVFSSHKRWESVQLEFLALRRNFKKVGL